MSAFPRTTVGGLSVSRMIIGTNWFLGWSHRSSAQDAMIKERMADYRAIADVIEVFLKAGVDTIMAPISGEPRLQNGIKEAEQRTGVRCIRVDTPIINIGESDRDRGEAEAVIEHSKAVGSDFCMPHHSSVEQLIDKHARKIRRLGDYTKMIRDRGMIPGLSAHMPEVIQYADEKNEDVETYIQIYNAAGFLMQVEIETINRVIHDAKKPVMTIKPMAAGRLTPFVGLNFSWATIRPCDMVTVGTSTPREAAECIEISLAALEGRRAELERRATPSKGTILTD